MIYLDTHVVVWLYMGDVALLSRGAAAAIEREDLLISPLVMLELQYLLETKRITATPDRIVASLAGEIGLAVCPLPFAQVVKRAIPMKWTRDPFDRLIVAQAKLADASLVSKDRAIQQNYTKAIW